MKYSVFDTQLGWIGVLASPKGIRRMTIPVATPEEALRRLDLDAKDAELDSEPFNGLQERVRRLFDGEDVAFEEPLDFARATPFKVSVWKATATIPRGETRSYGEIAAQVGRPTGARAVGQAMAANPISIIIPCHRVIAGDGTIGGYGDSIETKRRLLAQEQARGVKTLEAEE